MDCDVGNRQEIERRRREAERCRIADGPNLTPNQELGAIQGEVDWLVAQQIGRRGTAILLSDIATSRIGGQARAEAAQKRETPLEIRIAWPV